ncbi:MAG: FkbM family methyltransferase [Nitrospirae bacterium]|nr:FkbM family methyltransferase [Nitrospirota bacterium]
METNLRLNVVDAGARYGIHPSLDEIKHIASFHLFEIDGTEAQRLTEKYKQFENIDVYHLGLGSGNSLRKVNIRRHPGLSGFLDTNEAVFEDTDYMKDEIAVTGVSEVGCVTLDDFLAEDMHFIKLDTEGTELEILKGAARHLQGGALGVRSEVQIGRFYKGQGFFSEINALLLGYGFELLNLDYDGRGVMRSRFTLPGRYGFIAGFDAIWCKRKSLLLGGAVPGEIRDNVIRMALFYMLNNATDCALDILLSAVDTLGLSFGQYADDPVFLHLMAQVGMLFYRLERMPYFKKGELDETFARIFNREPVSPFMRE